MVSRRAATSSSHTLNACKAVHTAGIAAAVPHRPSQKLGNLTFPDIMNMGNLIYMPGIDPLDLSARPAMLKYLHRIREREAYQRAMARGGATVQAIIVGKK